MKRSIYFPSRVLPPRRRKSMPPIPHIVASAWLKILNLALPVDIVEQNVISTVSARSGHIRERELLGGIVRRLKVLKGHHMQQHRQSPAPARATTFRELRNRSLEDLYFAEFWRVEQRQWARVLDSADDTPPAVPIPGPTRRTCSAANRTRRNETAPPLEARLQRHQQHEAQMDCPADRSGIGAHLYRSSQQREMARPIKRGKANP
jgi:hypothetical protein